MPVIANRLLDLDPGVGQVASMVRFQVLDRDLTVVGEIVPLAADSVSANVSGNVKRTLSGLKLDELALREIDPFRHRIKPLWCLEDGTEWPLGVFVFTAEAAHIGSYISTLDTTMMDQDYMLDQPTRAAFGVGQNGEILPKVLELLAQIRILSSTISAPWGSTARVADPVVWPAGTSRMQILKDLCALAGWLVPYFDNNGVLTLRPASDVSNVIPDHIYPGGRVLRDSIVSNDNLLNAPNVYVVTCSGPSNGEITASAEVAEYLPFSVYNRRFEIVKVIRAQGITSTEQAQQMADTYAAGAGVGFRTVQFEATADPRHDLFQTVQWGGLIYREIQWSLKLRPGGSHSHSITQGGFGAAG